MTSPKAGISLKRAFFFLGWMLSPFTTWNDVFLNIPLSYLCANFYIRIHRADFLFTVLVFYWISNILGIVIMVASGHQLVRNRKDLGHELLNLAITITLYSAALIILHKIGVLKPV